VPRVPRPLPFFRYWVDSQALSSSASTVLLERALVALGGRRTGGAPKTDEERGAEGGPPAALAAAGGGGGGPAAAARRAVRLALTRPDGGSGDGRVAPLAQRPPRPPREYGYMHMGEWDFLWSITAKATLAAEVLRPGQVVSVVPGCLSISRKTSLVRSLVQAYGPGLAFSVVPRTYKLPEELDAWAGALAREEEEQEDVGRELAAASPAPPPPERLWMLKNNKQRGTGLRLVRGGRGAFSAAFETAYRPGKMAGLPLYRWYLAQRYVSDPLLLRPFGGTADWVDLEDNKAKAAARNGGGGGGGGAGAPLPLPLDNRPRKFGLRLWALVPSASPPFRAYIHQCGLALFSSRAYGTDDSRYWAQRDADDDDARRRRRQAGGRLAAAAGDAGHPSSSPPPPPPPPVPEGHLTNAAQNAGAPVWPLSRVAETLGPAAWAELWEGLCRASALALAASARRVAAARRELPLPAGAQGFQLFGLDFVVDAASLRPWLLEVNATPSMRVDHPCPRSAEAAEAQKWPPIWDALALLRIGPERFLASSLSSPLSSLSPSPSASPCPSSSASPCPSASPARGDKKEPGSGARRWPFRRRRGQGRGGGEAPAAGGGGGGERGGAGGAAAAAFSLAEIEGEMRRAGGYAPLTHLFPCGETMPGGCGVPWTAADDALRRWLVAEQRRRGEGGAWHAWRGAGGGGGGAA